MKSVFLNTNKLRVAPKINEAYTRTENFINFDWRSLAVCLSAALSGMCFR